MKNIQQMPALPDSIGIGPAVWAGIQSLLFDYAELHPGDHVIVVYTPEVRASSSWVCLALELMGVNYSILPMKPLSDCGFQSSLRDKVAEWESSSGKCIVLVFEWETMSHNHMFREVFHQYHPYQRRIIRCINTGPDLFAVGIRPHPEEVSRKNADLLHFVMDAREIRVQTPSGTDLQITLDSSRFEWISNRGISDLGRMIVLPPGEIATFPLRIDGTLVADFAVNVNYRFEGDVRLQENPVTVEIRNSQLAGISCQNLRVKQQLIRFFEMDNAKRVGELGFGTHPLASDAVAENSHLNERRVGVHIGFGQHNQDDEVAGYTAKVHVDLIAKGGSIFLSDGTKIDLEDVPRTKTPHPQLMKSVDLFSPDIVPPDCCGVQP